MVSSRIIRERSVFGLILWSICEERGKPESEDTACAAQRLYQGVPPKWLGAIAIEYRQGT